MLEQNFKPSSSSLRMIQELRRNNLHFDSPVSQCITIRGQLKNQSTENTFISSVFNSLRNGYNTVWPSSPKPSVLHIPYLNALNTHIEPKNHPVFKDIPLSSSNVLFKKAIREEKIISTSSSSSSAPSRDNESKQPSQFIPLIANAICGGLSGFIAFPFESTKKKVQSGQKIVLTWNEVMRGSSAFIFSVGPTTVVQRFTHANLITAFPHLELSPSGKIFLALAAGSSGSIVSTFVENTILKQQLDKSKPIPAIKAMFKQKWNRPWTGISALAGREATFGCCYLSLSGLTGDYAKSIHPGLEWPAKLLVGAGGALASHPFDTFATMMQKAAESKTPLQQSPFEQVKAQVKAQGLKILAKGAFSRIGLFTTVMVLNEQLHEPITEAVESCYKRLT